jgi:hypothetical protein
MHRTRTAAAVVATAATLALGVGWGARLVDATSLPGDLRGERVELEAAEPITDATLATLAAGGVAAYARSVHHRSLFYFFAPWMPVVVAVAPADAARARELCPS